MARPPVVAALVIAASATALPAAAITASRYVDFRIPESRLSWLDGGVGASYRSASFREGLDRDEGRMTLGHLSLQGGWLLDSERRRYEVSAWTSADLQRIEHSRRVTLPNVLPTPPVVSSMVEERVDRTANERLFVAGEARHYVGSLPLATLLGAGVTLDHVRFASTTTHQRLDRDSTSARRFEASSERDVDDLRVQPSVRAGLGVGRVRDATGVFLAELLEQRLRRAGVIRGPLPRSARRRLAALYYLRPHYGRVHERPDRFFWRDVERILRDEGLLEHGWEAFDLMRANEGYGPRLDRGTFVRPAGWFVGPSVVVQGAYRRQVEELGGTRRDFVDDSLVHESSHRVRRTHTERPRTELLLAAEAELHLPLSSRVQLDLATQWVAPERDFPLAYGESSSGSIQVLVADRWAMAATAHHQFSTGGGAPRRWASRYGVVVAWYLEDRLKMDLAANEVHHRDDPAGGFVRERRGVEVRLRLGYRFLGRLEAPGLMPPLTLLPSTWSGD